MSDRIDNPWGERTPFAAGRDWPARIDQHVEREPERWVQSACVLCSNGCALDIGVAEGRIVGVRGREVDRVNHGRLGPKGLYGWQANNAADRLTRPLVRRDGSLEETDWDTAMGAVVERVRNDLDKIGPSAIGFYTTGQLFIGAPVAVPLAAALAVRLLAGDTPLLRTGARWRDRIDVRIRCGHRSVEGVDIFV